MKESFDAGDRLGRYELLRPLGQGAAGLVFAARDELLRDELCVKVLHPKLAAHGEARERFFREVVLARQIAHPGVCRVYDVHTDGDVLFLTMELIDGTPLRDLINEPMPWRRALDMGRQIAEAVAAIHDTGVIHRDLKPRNIIVRPDDTIAVVDFGTSKSVESEFSLTKPGLAVGTMHYVAPEIWEGRTADARADLFSVAVVLYNCLTGRLPFEGNSPVAILTSIRSGKIALPTTQVPGIPPAIDDLMRKALAPRPEDRFPHARALSRALEELLRSDAMSAAAAATSRAVRSDPGLRESSGPLGSARNPFGGPPSNPAGAAQPATAPPLGALDGLFGSDAGAAARVAAPKAQGAAVALPQQGTSTQPPARPAAPGGGMPDEKTMASLFDSRSDSVSVTSPIHPAIPDEATGEAAIAPTVVGRPLNTPYGQLDSAPAAADGGGISHPDGRPALPDEKSWVVAGRPVDLPARPNASLARVVTPTGIEGVATSSNPSADAVIDFEDAPERSGRGRMGALVVVVLVLAGGAALWSVRHRLSAAGPAVDAADAGATVVSAAPPPAAPDPQRPADAPQPEAPAAIAPPPLGTQVAKLNGRARVVEAARITDALLADRGILPNDDPGIDAAIAAADKALRQKRYDDAYAQLEVAFARGAGFTFDAPFLSAKNQRFRAEMLKASAEVRASLDGTARDIAELTRAELYVDANRQLNEGFALLRTRGR